MELAEYIENVSCLCASKIKEFEATLCTLQEKAKRCEDLSEAVIIKENLKQVLDVWLTSTDNCISSFQDAMSVVIPTINWHKKKDMLEMFYLSGDNPWSFWLTYNLSEIENMLKDIETRWRGGLLKKIDHPEARSFVCCCDQKNVFRGYIISVLSKTWVRILNVDKGQIKPAKLDSCYELPKEFSEPHTNAIQCCLIKDEFSESKWNPDLTELFQTTLRESRLTVRILEQINVNPPKFLIELYAFNESSEVETSISHWVSSRLLPVLEALDNDVDNKNLYDYLDDDVFDPFCISALGINNSFSDSEPNEISNIHGKTKEAAEKPLEATSTFNWNDSPNSTNEKPRNRLAQFMNSEKERGLKNLSEEVTKAPFVKNSPTEGINTSTFFLENAINAPEFQPNSEYCSVGSDVFLPSSPKVEDLGLLESEHKIPTALNLSDDHGLCPAFVKDGFCWKPGCHKEHNKVITDLGLLESEHKIPTALNLSDDHGLCPAFVKDGFCWKPGCHKEHNKVITDAEKITSGDYERPAMPGNYNPTDDQRICSFYARNGYCWKLGCQKEHTKPITGKWTNDSAEVFKESYRKLCLPSIGSNTKATVTHIMCANAFYVILPRAFSDTEDDDETIESLNSNLNEPTIINELKILSTPPCFGQLIIAYSAKKRLWLRASVYDVYDNDIILAYFVDFGVTEEIKSEKCREILPQHIHLPYQAVYCSLSGLYIESSQDEAGKSFLEQLILDKEIHIEIKDSDIHDTRIEVVAFTTSGLNLNDVMIKRGFCSKFQR